MSASAFSKCACQSCGVHLGYPSEAEGSTIVCPQCGHQTTLNLQMTCLTLEVFVMHRQNDFVKTLAASPLPMSRAHEFKMAMNRAGRNSGLLEFMGALNLRMTPL